MLTFSKNPQVAEQQMQAILFYLITFGYIDGDFDVSERRFILDYVRKLVTHRVNTAKSDTDDKIREELIEKYVRHFQEEFERIDRQVKELFNEAVSRDEDLDTFVYAKLKLRCFEIFQNFDAKSQEVLMESVDELLNADGVVHPAEVKFRAELSALLKTDLDVELISDDVERPSLRITQATEMVAEQQTHPFFDQFEFHYSRDPSQLLKQIDADRELMDKVLDMWQKQKAVGLGKLRGKQKVGEFLGQEPFLDQHVYVLPPKPKGKYELIVLGDLHGCYSCLKAAVLQSRFFEKVKAFRADPKNNPDPKLVMLGDYIDRGLFSLNGVLRTVMQMFITAPEHVYLLRGNHEYYIEYKGQVFGGVKPAESINTLKSHVPNDIFYQYIKLFDAMPNMLLFDKSVFVHGGIPRDLLLKERFKDLSSLNDNDIRFQMMWSDPSTADVIPAELQEQSSRFAFGRLQAAAFLQRIGCHTLVRGHEKVNDGFKKNYDDENIVLITLFSAGGVNNADLPSNSTYRTVTPMAMTLTWENGVAEISPWEIDYSAYNDPNHNRFYQSQPELIPTSE